MMDNTRMRPMSRSRHSWMRSVRAGALVIVLWPVFMGLTFGVEW